jgi:hypothetical protein
MSLIPLVRSNDKNYPLFPLHQEEDAILLSQWHDSILPTIELRAPDYEGLNSLHIFRQGLTEKDSLPTILVSIGNAANEASLRENISALFDDSLRDCLRLSFEESSVRRTIDNQLPPICKPRNTSFDPYPRFGASIGIQGLLDSTATLGGFLVVNGRLLVLTVDHLIPEILADSYAISTTHPSQQEKRYICPWEELEVYSEHMTLCCETCRTLSKDHFGAANFHKAVELTRQTFQCEIATSFRRDKLEFFYKFLPDPLGAMTCRSHMRSRPSVEGEGEYFTEMDWALFATDKWPTSLDLHAQEISKGLLFSKVIPGAPVNATGRTSGYQTGLINTAMSLINHEGRFTREWSIIKDHQMTLKEWIEGGIGVDGDSGAWIIDRNFGYLYGMVWGRDRPTTNPICLFSPIEDIVADIKERTGAEIVCLP